MSQLQEDIARLRQVSRDRGVTRESKKEMILNRYGRKQLDILKPHMEILRMQNAVEECKNSIEALRRYCNNRSRHGKLAQIESALEQMEESIAELRTEM